MWQGAEAAYRDLLKVRDADNNTVKPAFILRGKNDYLADSKGQQTEDGSASAEGIVKDSSAVAVIGYTKSGPTRAAAILLGKADIPFLLPSATADTAVQASDDSRLTNCFRLPPSDSYGQGPAIAAFLNEWIRPEAKTVHAVMDLLGEGNTQYSQNLCASVRDNLEHVPHNGSELQGIFLPSEKTDVENIVMHVITQHDRVVVFCGYDGPKGAAQRFFEALVSKVKEQSCGPRGDKRCSMTLIFSDGASGLPEKVQDFADKVGNFDAVYISNFYDLGGSRAPASGAAPASSTSLEGAKRSCGRSNARAGYAYDAVLIIHQAMELIRKRKRERELNHSVTGCTEISRACLREELETEPAFAGTESTYTFQNGQNVFGNYYMVCYGQCTAAAAYPHCTKNGNGYSCEISNAAIVKTRLVHSQKTPLPDTLNDQ